MATSRSTEDAGGQVTVLLYSGRTDPQWRIAPGAAETLVRLWTTLRGQSHATVPTPVLGYRGCIFRMGHDHWHAFGGVVTHRTEQLEETRADPRRGFERAALSTAPAGLVPAGALPAELR